jgi:hypothetical protein
MEPEAVLQAVLDLWDDLPGLVGPAWPDVYARLVSLLQQMQRAKDAKDRSQLVNELILVFRPHREAGRQLREAMSRSDQERGRTPKSQGTAPTEGMKRWEELVHSLNQRAPAPTVTRYTDIACPRRVWVKTPRVSVVVRLTARPSEYSTVLEKLAVREGVLVQVHVEAPGFEVLNAPQQETPILPDQDSPPVVFDLRPYRVGDTRIKLDFYQEANPLGTVSVPVKCTAYEIAEQATTSLSGPLHLDADAEPPDLVLHVAWQESPPTLSFKLWEGKRWHRFAPIRLKRDPATDAAELYRNLTGLTIHSDPAAAAHQHKAPQLSPEAVDRRVKALGQNLWRELIPDDLKVYYAAQRKSWRDRSLLIVSDEPYLPWELVWPYQQDWEDETPWCCTLRVTRWLRSDARGSGTPKPPTRIRLQRLAILAPTDAALPSAQEESKLLRQLASNHAIQDVSPGAATWEAVMDLLERGGYDWLHVAAHGKFHPETPEFAAVIWLEKQVSFTPTDLVGPKIEGHIGQQRPAFVLNVCEGGRVGLGLTGLAGWATRLVSSGAGLFIGPQWDITDEKGLEFIEALYKALLQGETVGAAVQQARLAARQSGDPTWLSYSVYAHPNARVTLRTGSSAP